MNCELCGLGDKRFYRADIEGSVMTVCSECAKNGKIISELNPEPKKSIATPADDELRLDFSKIIVEAMKEEKTSVEDLARITRNSPADIKKIINGKLIPTMELSKRLERALKINLFYT